ncbi:MAG: helix-turn-helix domain-containing protein [Candidatus Endonucleobacter sp. (ex Gigantidas childressi)]|nr:helix-turn-helix domain-containing protein [Candidatus Endonucleobacter sp. (ex Gigantidas childressi)]
MKYQQLTEGDRYMIVALKWQGLSFTDIATAIGKYRSTIFNAILVGIRMPHVDPSGHSKEQELDVDVQGKTNILQKRIT